MPDRFPFEGVTDYFSELNRMRHTGVRGRDQGPEDQHRTHASAWVPACDIFAHGDDLVVQVELAGVRPDEIDLGFAHGALTVSGSRHGVDAPRGGDGENGDPDAPVFYVRERFHGAFRRVVTLPEGTEQSQISAVFDDGLVEITVRGGAARPDTGRIELRSASRGASSRSLG